MLRRLKGKYSIGIVENILADKEEEEDGWIHHDGATGSVLCCAVM